MATKQQQVAEIVEGTAVGLAALGVTHVSSWKLDLEFAFSHAWRRWAFRGDYPSINRAAKPDNEFWIGVTRSERRKGAAVIWRHDSGEYEIVLGNGGWTPEEAVRLIGDRPLDDWIALASPFKEHLERKDV
ncbi:hypothetical protein IDH50_03205 [Aeromicrobium tamlense]|uniref:Uncharacterized protein n=1 Tax=Aeromicrobium tamlense TaxID=375541 RepID=A0A8I0FWH1_9ACTN|nr:hypothetical protein [Aeromicrobium tamlense]MBD1269232.1 hypothetical protein [Aeromicrobium tamlense]NYI36860.1 hypothetical protein [Aeromicrobium tamlense]